jgi:hypothetical protein
LPRSRPSIWSCCPGRARRLAAASPAACTAASAGARRPHRPALGSAGREASREGSAAAGSPRSQRTMPSSTCPRGSRGGS